MALLESTLAKAVAGVLALTVVAAGGVGAAFATGAITLEQPTVQGVETEWGEVTAETTEIETHVTVENPNPLGVPGIATIEYAVSMNDVTVAEGSKGGVGLPAGTSTIDLSAEIDNSKIPEWWASHVNNGERTVVTIRASVGAAGLFSQELPPQRRTVETDILGALTGEGNQSLTAGGRTLLTVTDRSASWGEATAERAPLTVSLTVHNPSNVTMELSGLAYAMTMNDVTVAEGEATGGVTLEPGETETIDLEIVIDSSKLDEWWVSHVRNDERTVVSMNVSAIAESGGERVRVPLSFLSPTLELETDILGGGGASVERIEPADGGFDLEAPALASLSTEWTVVDERTTRMSAVATVDNPNNGTSPLSELLSVDVGVAVRMNDVLMVNATATDREIQPGENRIEIGDTIEPDRVQAWWVSHINAGERTEVSIDPRVTVDVGFAALGADVSSRQRTLETDMLAKLDSDEERSVSVGGRELVTIERTRGRWGEATMERTPLVATATVRNGNPFPLVFTEVGYTVTMNDVVLANGTTRERVEVAPGSTETIETTAAIDNSKIPRWWVTHVRNDETTELVVRFYALVEYQGVTSRVPLAEVTDTIRTDVLGE